MSADKNTLITSYFQPEDREHHDTPSKTPAEGSPEDQPTADSSTPQDSSKAKDKRRLSASPTPPPCKRQDTKKPPTYTSLSYKDLPTTHLAPLSPPPPTTLRLTHHTGSIFLAPPNTLLLHACNTQGSWGAGIALAFKQHYPRGYTLYHAFCTQEHSFQAGDPVPVGTTLLIPPVDAAKGHWIGCLFTSRRYGRGKDGVHEILANTVRAVEGCLELVRLVGPTGIKAVRMCMVNSGKFGVPWERTEEVLKGVGVREGWVDSVEVWSPEGA